MNSSSPSKSPTSPQFKARLEVREMKNRKDRLLDFKNDSDKEDLQLRDKQKLQVTIGTKFLDKFDHYVASGDFQNEVDFKVAELVQQSEEKQKQNKHLPKKSAIYRQQSSLEDFSSNLIQEESQDSISNSSLSESDSMKTDSDLK